jgi:hypothetical protein
MLSMLEAATGLSKSRETIRESIALAVPPWLESTSHV